MPPFEIKEVTTKDEFDKVTELEWTSYYNPYRSEWQFLHPIFGTTALDRHNSLKYDTDRLWTSHLQDASSHWIYALDTSTQEMVGATEWLFYRSNPFPKDWKSPVADWWPEGPYRDFTTELVRLLYTPRAAWCHRGFAALNGMAVLPQHRKKGIATLLMEWGIRRLDEMGLDSLVEATEMGERLYERFGYRHVISVAVDVRKRDVGVAGDGGKSDAEDVVRGDESGGKGGDNDVWNALRAQLGQPVAHIYWRPKLGEWTEEGPKAPWEMPVEE
ncbi:MAG: hypothetical protein Q9159_004902 [Coniocarpon cinnabarinum]